MEISPPHPEFLPEWQSQQPRSKEHEEEQEYFKAAKKSDGISKSEPFPLPTWVSIEKIKAGQEFVREHFFSVFFAHFISLIFLLAYTPVRLVLLRTGKSESTIKSLKRYLSTLVHIKCWYEESDICESHGKAAEDIRQIRLVHSRVAKTIQQFSFTAPSLSSLTQQCKYSDMKDEKCHNINSCENNNNISSVTTTTPAVCDDDSNLLGAVRRDFKNLTVKLENKVGNDYFIRNHENNNGEDDSEIFQNSIYTIDNSDNRDSNKHIISQLDMMVTQFCFMGFIQLYPKTFGIYKTKKDENNVGLEGFIHLWALIGHLLGIEDQFNLCLSQNIHKTRLVLNRILIPELEMCVVDTVTLWKSLTAGISTFVPCISLRAVLGFVVRNLLLLPQNHDGESTSMNGLFTRSNTTSVSTSEISSLFTLYDHVCYTLMSKCFSSWLHYSSLRSFFNSLLRLAVYLQSMKILRKKTQTYNRISPTSTSMIKRRQTVETQKYLSQTAVQSIASVVSNSNMSTPSDTISV